MKQLLLSILVLFSVSVQAQKNDTTINWNLIDLPLKELVNIEVETASKNASSLRISPGIITVLTETEIKNSGANNLLELLNFIPGFDFSAEWDNILGLGVRGNNATEGKFLILMDGFQMNETNFGSFPFQQHILTDNIKRIEVIRGPGSAIYGGAAELAVINIITKKGAELQGGSASVFSSVSDGSLLSSNAQVVYGEQPNKNFSYKIAASHSIGNGSNKELITRDTTHINYRDSSQIRNSIIQMQLTYKDLNVNLLYDNYLSDNTEALGQIKFEGLYAGVNYKARAGKNCEITPFIKWNYQKPWYFVNFKEKEFYNSVNQRLNSGVVMKLKAHERFHLVLGADVYKDFSQKIMDTVVFSKNKKSNISFFNSSVFSEFILNTNFGNLNLGARYDHHSHFGGAFVPRIAYTKAFNAFHIKLLYSKAYKAPTLSNIDYNENIKPEYTTVYEIETGALIGDQINLIVNFFDIRIKDPILYIPNPSTGADYYTNFEKTGSQGVELSIKYKPSWGYFNIAYSYYQKSNNTVPDYEVEGHQKTYGGFPQHRLFLNSNISLSKAFTLGTTFKFSGLRYSYIHADKNWETLSMVTFDPVYLINLYLQFAPPSNNNWNATLGVNNILNQDYFYLNPYKGGQNPIPEASLTVFGKLTYYFNSPQ